jgi:hypothetical protein
MDTFRTGERGEEVIRGLRPGGWSTDCSGGGEAGYPQRLLALMVC